MCAQCSLHFATNQNTTNTHLVQVEKMILGNKCDMEDKRKISTEQGKQLADEYGVKFMETSAMNRTNVEKAFTEIATDIKRKMDARVGPAHLAPPPPHVAVTPPAHRTSPHPMLSSHPSHLSTRAMLWAAS